VDDHFFVLQTHVKEYDILIEGNNEPNKGIDEALEIAKEVGGLTAWLGRETKHVPWIRATFTNPPQALIPRVYQESRITLKTSKSEGFGLPHLEAMASGSVLVSYNSGGNMDFCIDGVNCRIVDKNNAASVIKELLNDPDQMEKLKSGGYTTASLYKMGNNVERLIEILTS
jgi:glycosyltransferase involved in cell wall biosynthesis